MPFASRARLVLGIVLALLVTGQLMVVGTSDLATTGTLSTEQAGRGDPSRPPLTVPPQVTTTTVTPRTLPPTPSTTAVPPSIPATAAPTAPATNAPTIPVTNAPTIPPTTAPATPDPPLGVTLSLGSVSSTAAAPVGCPAGATCWQARVDCPSVRPATAHVAIRPAVGQATGVVVLFGGGRGDGWWEDGPHPGSGAGAPALADLARGGLETVQVRWDGGFSGTDEGTSPGFAHLACRSATAVSWVRSWRYQPLGAGHPAGRRGFCITGNSGGASQAAWALTHFGLAGSVDRLVLTSGPPHTSIDKGCLRRPGESAWWYDAGTAADFDIPYGTARGGLGPCASHDPGEAAAWQRDGVGTGGSDYSWPSTAVTFLFGAEDPTVGPAHGADLADRLRREGSPMVAVQVVRGMGHEVMGSPAGRQAFVAAMLDRT